MTDHPRTPDPDVLVDAVRQAVARNAGESWDALDVESLALLASGRGSTLPPPERVTLLKRIAQDPDLGRLLQDLRDDLHEADRTLSQHRSRTPIRLAWVACVIATITVALVQVLGRNGPSSVKVMDTGSNQPEFLEQLGVPTMTPSDLLLRDPVFLGLFALAVVLGVASFWPRKTSDP